MKKFLTLALMCFISVVTFGEVIDGVNYNLNSDGTASVNSINEYLAGFSAVTNVPETVEYNGDYYMVTAIGSTAALQNTSLTCVYLPSTIESIGTNAFNGCTNLTVIYCYAVEPPTLSSNAFNGVTATVYVPAESVEAYESSWGASFPNLTFAALDDEGGTEPEPSPATYNIIVTPSDGDVLTEAISEIVVSCEDGIEWNTNVSLYFQVKNSNGDVVAGAWTAVMKEESGDMPVAYSLPLYDDAITSSDVPITLDESGQYTFTIPEGAFYLGSDKQESKAVDVTFSLELGGTEPTGDVYTIEPANNSLVDKIDSFTISLSEDIYRSNNGIGWLSFDNLSVVNSETGSQVTTAFMDYYVYPEGLTNPDPIGITFTCDETVTADGTYTITIPSGCINFGDGGVQSENIVITYTVGEGGTTEPEPTEYVLSFYPENGGEMTIPEGGLTEVVISCEDGLSYSSSFSSRTWVLYNESKTAPSVKKVEANETSITFILDSAITTADTYSLAYMSRGNYITTIPAGEFLLGPDGVESEEMTYSFTLVAADEPGDEEPLYTVEPSEDEPLTSLSSVTFIAEHAICWTEDVAVSEVKVYKDNEVVATGSALNSTWTSGTWDDAEEIVFDTELTESGEYKVVVPAGFFFLGSWTNMNDVIELNYTIVGAEEESIYYLDPADGSEVARISTFDIYLSDDIYRENNGMGWLSFDNLSVVNSETGSQVTTAYMSGYLYPENPSSSYPDPSGLEFKCSSNVTAAGTYTITIPSGSINFGDAGVQSEDIVITYTVVTSGEVTITSVGYATYYTDLAYVMPTGLVGTTITAVNVADDDSYYLSAAWEYEAGTTVPAGTALVLKGDEGTYTYSVSTSSAAAPSDNLLLGSSVDVVTTAADGNDGDYYYYELTDGDNGVAFYWANEDGSAFTSEAHKAWLPISKEVANVKVIKLESEGDATGITSVDAATTSDAIYTIQGVRVNNMNQRGIYIVGGKKVLVK